MHCDDNQPSASLSKHRKGRKLLTFPDPKNVWS
jgi:hypothetical protein